MSFVWTGLLDFFLLFAVLLLLAPLLGIYLVQVFTGKKTFLHPLLRWSERLCYRLGKVHPQREMTWQEYAKSILILMGIGFCFTFLVVSLQYYLPLNPENFPGVPWPLAFNISASLITSTGWLPYTPENTLSYLSRMLGLGTQMFLTPATGLAVLFAFIRGLTRRTSGTIGNFWVDLVRSLTYVLLPLSLIFALFFIFEGALQTLSPYERIQTLEGGNQTIPLGLSGSHASIKQLGGTGVGFFKANGAHPFVNPTTTSNFLQIIATLLIPTASIFAFGIMIRSKKHAFLIFFVMLCFFFFSFALALTSETFQDPLFAQFPLREGLETRFGISKSLLSSVATNSTANGSQNVSLTSLPPLAGGAVLYNVLLGEQIFGGVGVGLCRMLLFIFLTVCLSGLISGRSAEYFGKKIKKKEIQWVVLAILTPTILILTTSAIALYFTFPIEHMKNRGPHGLTSLLFTFATNIYNNGGCFSGFNATTIPYHLITGILMLIGRVSILLPSLILAGEMARKSASFPSFRVVPIDSFFFALLLLGVIFLFGNLLFFPVLSLGPFTEHFLMLRGEAF